MRAPALGPVQSRRALLLGGLSGLVALAGETLGRPLAARAADGDTVKVGSDVSATGTTQITSSGSPAFIGLTSAFGHDDSTPAAGIVGRTVDPVGTSHNVGVVGYGTGANGIGVIGRNDAGVGVQGVGDRLAGVHGVSQDGYGVWAESNSTAVYAVGLKGHAIGVVAVSYDGIGLSCQAPNGTALDVFGKVTFNRSGRALVPARKSYVDVTVEGGLGGTSSIVATLQAYRPGVHVEGVRLNYPSGGKARIYLNAVASTTAAVAVGWFVLG